jgi:hypothetical protein
MRRKASSRPCLSTAALPGLSSGVSGAAVAIAARRRAGQHRRRPVSGQRPIFSAAGDVRVKGDARR